MKSLNLNNSKMILPIEVAVFAFFFLFVLVAGLLLQMVVLPLTPWHAGDGLMVGGDWILFQEVALKHAAEIREFGWSVAQLRPEGHGPSGLAAFMYAVTGVNKPWILLPIHALVFALAAVGLFWIVEGLSGSNRLGICALAPMCLMPSLAMVWGQLHKDVWAIAAVLLLLGFWLRLLVGRPLSIWIGLMVLIFVNLSLWWMRPYTLQIILFGQVVLLFFLLFVSVKLKRLLPIVLGFFALLSTYTFLESTKVKSDGPYVQCKEWSFSLPSARLDYALLSIACTRDALMTAAPDARSNIDADISFSSAKDVFAYMPRATLVGVLTPFPNMWFAEGTFNASQVFRLVAAVETMAMYIALMGVVLGVALNVSRKSWIGLDKSVAIFALIGFAMVWIGVYALASGNVGSLYRVRYPIMLLWMGLGLWGWTQIIFWWRDRSKAFNETSF